MIKTEFERIFEEKFRDHFSSMDVDYNTYNDGICIFVTVSSIVSGASGGDCWGSQTRSFYNSDEYDTLTFLKLLRDCGAKITLEDVFDRL